MTALILRPSSFSELAQFAGMAAKSAMVPPAFRGKPEDIMLAVQMGSELGLAPMQALQSIAVINNRPSVWGDALIGLCRASPHCEDIAERIEGDGDNAVAYCTAKRRGATAVVARFSVDDARKAGLWGKAGPWLQYPRRMLQMRARGFALRDAFPDVLRGLIAAEEAADTPPAVALHRGVTIEAAPAPAIATPTDQAQEIAAEIIGAVDAAADGPELFALVDNPAIQKRRAALRDRRPELSLDVEAAFMAAQQRVAAPPLSEAGDAA